MAIAVRVSNYEFVFRDYTGHLNFIDTDCYYYLRRLVHFLANFPQLMMFDPLSNWPSGSWVAWPEGFLLLVGIPLKIFGVSTFSGLEIGVCLVMLVLGLFCSSMALMWAQRLIRNFYLAILVFFLVSVNFLLVRFSCLGQIDHHIMEATLPPLILWLSDKAFRETEKSTPFILGFVLAFSLLISSSSLFIVGVFYALYIFVYGRLDTQKRFLQICATFLVLILPYAIWSVRVRGDAGAITQPSYFHLSLIILLSLSSWLLVRFSRFKWAIVAGGTAVFVFFYWLGKPTVLMEPLHAAISYVFSKGGVLQNVSEVAPIFRNYAEYNFDFMVLNFGFLIWVLPAAWICLLFWRRWTQTERAFLLAFSLLSIPGITQKRFSQLMVVGFIVFLVWVVDRLHREFGNRIKWAAPVASIFVLCFTCAPLFHYGFAPMGSPRDGVDLGAAGHFIKRLEIKPEDVWNRLSGKESVTEGFWANPNMGHVFLYTTGFAAVTNSFYFSEGMNLDFRLRTFQAEDELRVELKKNRIRYAILADDFIYLDMQFKMNGEQNAGIIKYEERNGRMSPVVQISEVQKYAWARILMQDWDTLGFQRLFEARFQEPHFYKFVKGIRFTEF